MNGTPNQKYSQGLPSGGTSTLGRDLFLPSFSLHYGLKGMSQRGQRWHEMRSTEQTILLVPHPFYAMLLLWEEERKSKEKNTTKQVLQNILRSRLPVSASSTIVCELKIYIFYSKLNNVHQLQCHQYESINMMFSFLFNQCFLLQIKSFINLLLLFHYNMNIEIFFLGSMKMQLWI